MIPFRLLVIQMNIGETGALNLYMTAKGLTVSLQGRSVVRGGTDSQDELVCKAGVTVISCGLAPQYDLRSLSLGRVRSQSWRTCFESLW